MHINSNCNEMTEAMIIHLFDIFLHHIKHIKSKDNVLNAREVVDLMEKKWADNVFRNGPKC